MEYQATFSYEVCNKTHQSVRMSLILLVLRVVLELFAQVSHDRWRLAHDEVTFLYDRWCEQRISIELTCSIEHSKYFSRASLSGADFNV